MSMPTRPADEPCLDASTYANLKDLLAFLDAPHVLEVLEGAWHGIPARQALPASVDDDAVMAAVCRILADGVADLGPAREDPLHATPKLTARGRQLLSDLSDM